MNPFLECQLFNKAKKLIKRKIKNLTAFQRILLNEEFIEAISAADEIEESFEDILIFDISPNFRNYESTFENDLSDLEDLKGEVMADFEMRIADCREMSPNESMEMLEEMIENSKELLEKYLQTCLTSINHLKRKLTVISHIFIIDTRTKKLLKCYQSFFNNLKNFPNLISVSNAKRILIENFESLEFLLEETFENPQIIVDKIREMQPNRLQVRNIKCPSVSDSDSSDGIYVDDEEPPVQKVDSIEPKKSSVDCFFVQPSSASNTRVDSIEKLETNLDKLNEQIESIESEKLALEEEIYEKRKKLNEAILKVIEFEKEIESIERLMEKNLHRFQLRIISLENKLLENFKGYNDRDLQELLENEINDIKSDHKLKQAEIESSRDGFVVQAQTFAYTLSSDILSEFSNCHCDEINILTDIDEINDKKQKFKENRKSLEKLLSRPAKFCRDKNGERFFMNSKKEKIYQVHPYSSEYSLEADGNRIKIKNGFPLENDENGEFYLDSIGNKIYTKYFFENEHGRFFIDFDGDRHYQADAKASEYQLVDGEWIKIKDGTYERDEKGIRKWPKEEKEENQDGAEGRSQTIEEILDFDCGPNSNKIKPEDIKYIKDTVGPAIIKGLAAVARHQPSDPVKYFADFLLHYRFSKAFYESRDAELKFFLDLREKIKSEKCSKS